MLHADTLAQQVCGSTVGSLVVDVHWQQDPAAPFTGLHLSTRSHDDRSVLSGQRPVCLVEREAHVPAENILKQLPCPRPSPNTGKSQVVLSQIVVVVVAVVVVVVVVVVILFVAVVELVVVVVVVLVLVVVEVVVVRVLVVVVVIVVVIVAVFVVVLAVMCVDTILLDVVVALDTVALVVNDEEVDVLVRVI